MSKRNRRQGRRHRDGADRAGDRVASGQGVGRGRGPLRGSATWPGSPSEPASAGQTVVSFMLRPVEEGGPWPLTRVLTALGQLEVERVDVARALGDRHGIPLIHSQQLRWRDLDIVVEARHGHDGVDELSVELPPWDEVMASAGSDAAWQLLDTVAAASDARFGCVGDGEPPETTLASDPAALGRQLRRHLGLLLPSWTADEIVEAGALVQRSLPSSGLVLVIG